MELEFSPDPLTFAAKNLTQSHLHFANCIVVAISITINEEQLKHLFALKVICHLNSSLEVGVQTVIDLFSLADLDPLGLLLLEDDAHRIRLAHPVQVLQLMALHI